MGAPVWGFVWKSIVSTAISYATNAIANKLFGSKNENTSPTYSFGGLRTQTNSGMAMAMVYGSVKCAGNIIWASDAGTTQHKIVSFGVGRNKAIREVKFNDMSVYYNNIFYIKNTKYADATVRIFIDPFNRPTGNDKVLRLFANGITTNINLQAGVDQHSNGDNDFSCYLHKLIKYLREDGYSNGLMAQGWIIEGGYACNTNARPEALYNIALTNCYNKSIKVEGENSVGAISGCSYTTYLGDGEQPIDSRVTGITQEDKAKVVGGLKYDCYVAITATASDQLNNDYNVTAIVDGRIVKIYTSPTTYYEDWSDNPAWCILDFMTSIDGCGMSVNESDIRTLLSASIYYDQLVNGRKRFVFNMIMDEKKSRQDWLDEILITCRSYRTYQRGLHGILVDKPENVSQIFNVKPDESIETWWQDNSEDIERLQIEYIDPDYEYTKVIAQADRTQLPGEATQFRNKTPLTKKIQVYGINNFEQASMEAWFQLNKAQTCPEWIQYTTNKRALNRSIGDVVGIWNPITEVVESGLPYKRYRIMSMNEPQENKITMVMQEYNWNLYFDTMGSVSPTINISNLQDPSAPPPPVTNLVAKEFGWTTASGTLMSSIDISFTGANYFSAVSYDINLSNDGGKTWRYISNIRNTSYRIENVALGNYMVRVYTINRHGIYSIDSAITSMSVVGKDSPPPDVESLLVETLADKTRRFIWNYEYPEHNDIAGFRIKYNAGKSLWWESAIDITTSLIKASPYETQAFRSGIYTVMIKAVDNMGNESENFSYAILGIGEALVDNVLFEEDMSDFVGKKINCNINSNGVLQANDTKDMMYSANESAPMYPNDNDWMYTAMYSNMIYYDTFTPDGSGLLSFDYDIDGNAIIWYRKKFPYSMYSTDKDIMFNNDGVLMYREGIMVQYYGKVETVPDVHEIKIEIQGGHIRPAVRKFVAVVDVPDVVETVNDLVIGATGTRIPITKKYIRIKNVNVTIQDTSTSNATSVKIIDKHPKLGALVMLYDKNNVACSGLIDATIQGY